MTILEELKYKNLTDIARARKVKYKELKKALQSLNIVRAGSNTPTFYAIEYKIAIPIVTKKNGLNRTHWRYDPKLIDRYLTTCEMLPASPI